MRLCQYCRKPISRENQHRAYVKYCSPKCRNQKERERRLTANPRLVQKMASVTRGAISELRVCADLLNQGYEVYRSVSPSCPTDIIGIKNNQLSRVQVKTGSMLPTGKKHWSKPQNTKYDLLAIVFENHIEYQVKDK